MIEETLVRFTSDMKGILHQNLVDVIIHGSVVLHDFRPGQGDIDYLVITRRDLDEQINRQIFEMHDRYRQSKELLLYQLEGTFYPQHALTDLTGTFVGCYIGTTRPYWHTMTRFENSLMDLLIIAEHGRRLLGSTTEIYRPTQQEIHEEQISACKKLAAAITREQRQTLADVVSTIHWCGRTISYLNRGRIASKGEACGWCREFFTEGFRELFVYAEDRRYPYGKESPDPRMVGQVTALIQTVGSLLGC